MLLSRKSIIHNTTLKAQEISRKMDYCFPDFKCDLDVTYINLFTILYYHELQHRPHDPLFEGRDRLILTKGRYIANLFAVLSEVEYFGWNTALQLLLYIDKDDHSLISDVPGIYSITDTPELAVTIANGLALRAKATNAEFNVYMVMENITNPIFYETLFSTSRFKLDNVTAILNVPQNIYKGSIIHNWFALGWHIEEVNFLEMDTIFNAFSHASRVREKPTVLIG